jgi:hypothetical protein
MSSISQKSNSNSNKKLEFLESFSLNSVDVLQLVVNVQMFSFFALPSKHILYKNMFYHSEISSFFFFFFVYIL